MQESDDGPIRLPRVERIEDKIASLERKVSGIVAFFGLTEADLERALAPPTPEIETGLPDLKED